MFDLKPLSKSAVPAALAKAERYRLLNEPMQAASICEDVLRVDPDNAPARVALILALSDEFGGAEQALDAYERLIHDVMVGDRTFFTISDAIERLWEISAPLLEDPPSTRPYEPGSWGPVEAEKLIAPRRWHLPSDHV